MVGLLLLICQCPKPVCELSWPYCALGRLVLYWPHTKGKHPLIYSPACSLYDQSRVWVARSVDPDVESMIQRQYGPSDGESAWFVAARHARCYAHDLEKTT